MQANPSRNKKLQAPRASFHDYTAPGFYHITITAHPGTPPLSVINHREDTLIKRDMIIPDNTPLGESIRQALESLLAANPLLRIRRYVIMPDHLHFILQVVSKLDKPIGRYIAAFTKNCSQAFTQIANRPSFSTLFCPFDDQIIFNYLQLDRAIKYIEDNPRRYLLRKRFPNLFQRHLHICIDNHNYAAYGNIFLLKAIYLLPIRIHRRWSQAEFDQYSTTCLHEIAAGAVPISPSIHKAEKDIVRKAVESGSSVIILRELSFNERFKPQGELFELCAAGRLLLLSPWPDNLQRRSTAGYKEFHKMNDHAAAIAALPASARLSLRPESKA